ncbi:uncharacterized protein [Primulina eburnea]|uniref:uncharacterized protein isoform X2 n=1 Tax=Primulina eburnea TaxID=1245227 RepID=UPI003C6BDF18
MFSYFKPKASTSTRDEHSPTNDEISNHDEQYPVKYQRVDSDVCGYVQLDPAKCTPIWQCPVNERDAIRRAYILRGPYQHVMEYPRTKLGEQYRRFQKIWFEQFPWLEYSPNKDAAFCFPCFLFQQKEARYAAFTVDGFRGWKRVNDGKRCALLMHTGSPTSPHNNAVESMSALMNVSGHIDKVMNAQTLEEVKKNRLKLTTTIESIRWLCLQGCALRGNDESSYSKNQGTGLNQIGTLQRAGKTRWSSHFELICSMIYMYSSVIIVLEHMMEEASSNSIRGEAIGFLIALRSFDFIFILYLMHKIIGITDLLFRALQEKS